MANHDFIVVGAGIAGASAAYELQQHGSVALLEREPLPGQHTTGRSAAFLVDSYSGPVVGKLTRAGRPFFEQPSDDASPPPVAEWSAYLTAIRTLLPRRALAVDLGTGDGALVELLAPLFDRVIAVDRSEEQLRAAERRLSSHGYDHVELVQASYDDAAIVARVRELGGADAVFAVRLLHHAPRPQQLVSLLGLLVRPGGQVIVIDYCSHDDELMRERATG